MQKPIVNHVTRVRLALTASLPIDFTGEKIQAHHLRETGNFVKEHYDKIAAIMDVLAELEFRLSADESYIYGESATVGAREAKEYLLAKGFHDRDFQINLEYTRGWGMM